MKIRVAHPHVACDPDILDGRPYIIGSRVPVSRLWAWHRGGAEVAVLVKRYPNLGPAKIMSALAFAYDNPGLVEEDRNDLGSPQLRLAVPDADEEATIMALTRAGLIVLVRRVIEASGFTLAELVGPDRGSRRLARARHEMWREAFEMRDEMKRHLYSLPELGRLFNRDHTTLIAGIRSATEATEQGT